MVVLLVKVKPKAVAAVKPNANASDRMTLCCWFIFIFVCGSADLNGEREAVTDCESTRPSSKIVPKGKPHPLASYRQYS